MKKLKIFTVCFFVMILICIVLCIVASLRAQEGCGEWVEVEQVIGHVATMDSFRLDRSVRHCNYYRFVHPDDLVPPCSVWVPKPCPDTATVLNETDEQISSLKRIRISDINIRGLHIRGTAREAKVETVSGDWYYEFKLESTDMIIRIRIDTMWFVGDSVWIEKPLWRKR